MPEQSTDPPGRLNDLLRPGALAAFDRESFEREGYWVWENILTDEGRRRWTASLQKLQHMNDEIVMDTDWEAIDFASRGLKNPIKNKITPEAPALVTRGYESHGVCQNGFQVYTMTLFSTSQPPTRK
jgi:hypothetical protein